MQRRSCFAIPLREQKVEYKNGGEVKYFVTMGGSYTQQGQSSHITFRPIKSGATVPLKIYKLMLSKKRTNM
jgi:hypothetical protein